MSNSRQGQKQRREQHESGETRRLILQAAQNLFMAHGYRAVTTRQVADACGITQPALYRHFSDKQDLYLSVHIDLLSQSGSALERIVKRDIPMSEKLRHAAIYLLSHTRQDMHTMFHDIEHELSPEAQARLSQAFNDAIVQPLRTIFEEGINNHLLRPPTKGGVTAESAVMLFLNLASRFVPASQGGDLVEARQNTVAERAKLMVDLFLYGIAEDKPL